MSLLAIKYQDHLLEILDQLQLPAQTKYIQVKGVEDGWQVINKMQVKLIFSLINILIKFCLQINSNLYDCRLFFSNF